MMQDRFQKYWLNSLLLLVFAMVIVGGATRLTDSGLSITEWQPLLGAIPPMTAEDWNIAFEKYRASSEYKLQNAGMSLLEFEFIYWWEWSHRFLGRLLGLVALLPALFFAFFTTLPRQLKQRYFAVPVLIGAQGLMGWIMVASGLVNRVDVSQYRLAAHLSLAFVIFAYVLWLRFTLHHHYYFRFTAKVKFAVLFSVLYALQVFWGGLVAGIDAGMGYNEWPLMDGKLIPSGLLIMQPAWLNAFENAMTVQFIHRLLAYALFILALWQVLRHRSQENIILFAAVTLQAVLGISTLLLQVPLALALVHQAGALFLMVAIGFLFHRITLQQ